MRVQTYFRICLFLPLIVPLPFLLFPGDEGLSALLIGSLVFAMPPYIIAFLLPFLFLFGRMSEKHIIIGVIFFPILYPLIFGLFWSIAPALINTSVKITLSNPSQWIFTAVVIPAAYSVIFLSGYIVRKLILRESDIHERMLATVLCADVKGYSKHMKRDESGTLRKLDAYRQEFERTVQEHLGKMVHIAGDSIVAKFTSVFDAMDCAIKLQQHFKARNNGKPQEEYLEYRIGMNLGDVIKRGKEIQGEGVDIAARIERISEPGGICVSGAVYDSIKNKHSFNYEYLGEKGMTNIAEPLRVYKILPDPPKVHAIEPETEVNLSIPDKPSIAVLPFENMSAYPEQEYISDGIAGEILTTLSMSTGLFVISRHSTFVYKGISVPLQQVSRDLGIRYVLLGSVRKTATRIFVTGHLTDAITDKILWKEKIDRKPEDIFAIPDEFSRNITRVLKVNLTEQEQKRTGYQVSHNPEAHDLLMRGQEQYFTLIPKNINQSIATFNKVIELDPDHAAAHAWKARALTYQFLIGINNNSEETVIPAVQLARKAIEIYDMLPLAHACLGWALMWNSEIDEAVIESDRALELDPNFADGNMWRSMIMSSAQRGEEALESIKIAVRMNPFHNIKYLFTYGVAYFMKGEYAKALSFFTRCYDRNPTYLPTHIFMTSCFGLLENKKEAEAARNRLLKLDPDCIFTGVSHHYIKTFSQLTDGLIKAGIEPA